jgi:hypothetical protein
MEKVPTGDFSAEVDREDVFKPTFVIESLQMIRIRAVSFAYISKNLALKSRRFPHCNVYKFTATSTGGGV